MLGKVTLYYGQKHPERLFNQYANIHHQFYGMEPSSERLQTQRTKLKNSTLASFLATLQQIDRVLEVRAANINVNVKEQVLQLGSDQHWWFLLISIFSQCLHGFSPTGQSHAHRFLWTL